MCIGIFTLFIYFILFINNHYFLTILYRKLLGNIRIKMNFVRAHSMVINTHSRGTFRFLFFAYILSYIYYIHRLVKFTKILIIVQLTSVFVLK